jgi:hypothetical protein
MHEQSETVGGESLYGLGALFRNVYGRNTPQAGQTLPKKYEFEREAYPNPDEAVFAARMRSLLTDENQQQRSIGLLDLLKMLPPGGPPPR